MLKRILKLSVLFLLCTTDKINADSFFIPLKGNSCVEYEKGETKRDARIRAYDKAVYLAIKSSIDVKKIGEVTDDYTFNENAYYLADRNVVNISLETLEENDNKICIAITADLPFEQVVDIFAKNKKTIDENKAIEIAKEVKQKFYKSANDIINTHPLIYVKDMLFYNNTQSALYTKKITEILSFEPNVLVTENITLADYILVPKLEQSKLDKIDKDHSRYNMSVSIALEKADGSLIDKKQQNRYIIIENQQNKQEIAHKLMIKLLEDALQELREKLNKL